MSMEREFTERCIVLGVSYACSVLASTLILSAFRFPSDLQVSAGRFDDWYRLETCAQVDAGTARAR